MVVVLVKVVAIDRDTFERGKRVVESHALAKKGEHQREEAVAVQKDWHARCQRLYFLHVVLMVHVELHEVSADYEGEYYTGKFPTQVLNVQSFLKLDFPLFHIILATFFISFIVALKYLLHFSLLLLLELLLFFKFLGFLRLPFRLDFVLVSFLILLLVFLLNFVVVIFFLLLALLRQVVSR